MNDVREDLKAFLDGELSRERAAAVSEALAADPALREELEALRAIGEGIREVALAPPVEGYEKTLAAVRRRLPVWRRVLPYAATLGVAVVLVAVLGPLIRDARIESDTAATVAMVPSSAMSESGGVLSDGAKSEHRTSRAPSPTEESEGVVGGSSPEATTLGPHSPAPAAKAAQRGSTVSPAERLVIQNGDITLRVDDALGAKSRAMAMAEALGGFVESSGQSTRSGGLPVATVTLRVPARLFETALDRLRNIEEDAEEIAGHTSGDDVTGQVADVEARLRVLRGEEEQYLTILQETQKIGDVLAVKERLSDVRQQIESLDAQQKVMRDQAALSTIVATFEQRESVGKPAGPTNWASDTWSAAVNGLSVALAGLGRAAIVLFVYSPIWIPVVVLAVWLVRRARRKP